MPMSSLRCVRGLQFVPLHPHFYFLVGCDLCKWFAVKVVRAILR